ncbi:hypothetical protein CW306_20520 [Bacillus sp. BA3]|nr:hypothetical protein CW306_20520 [Bacillus sp. BA3]
MLYFSLVWLCNFYQAKPNTSRRIKGSQYRSNGYEPIKGARENQGSFTLTVNRMECIIQEYL